MTVLLMQLGMNPPKLHSPLSRFFGFKTLNFLTIVMKPLCHMFLYRAMLFYRYASKYLKKSSSSIPCVVSYPNTALDTFDAALECLLFLVSSASSLFVNLYIPRKSTRSILWKSWLQLCNEEVTTLFIRRRSLISYSASTFLLCCPLNLFS